MKTRTAQESDLNLWVELRRALWPQHDAVTERNLSGVPSSGHCTDRSVCSLLIRTPTTR